MVTVCLEQLQALFCHTTESKEERSRKGFIFTILWPADGGGWGDIRKKVFPEALSRLALHFIGQN